MNAYLAELPVPGPAVDRAVARAIRERHGRAQRPSVWRWLIAPHTVRVRPAFAALAAALVALIWWSAARRDPMSRPTVAVSTGADTVLVRFELAAPDARAVAVAGTFNGWTAPGIPLRPSSVPGVWAVTLPLPVGEHRYLFIVDGERWMPDPSAHAQVDDGFGQQNSVIVVGPRGMVRS